MILNSKMEEKTHECPFCHSSITKKKYDEVIQENKLLKEKAKELEEEIRKLKSEKEKLQEKIKEAVSKERRKSQKYLDEIKQLKNEKVKFKEQLKDVRKREKQKYGEMLSRNARIIEKQKEEISLLKKGMSPQDAGFEFEKNMYNWLKAKFTKDNVQPTGKMGDSLVRVMNQGKEVGIILVECKKKATHTKKDVEDVKRHKITAKANVGVLVTNAYLGKKRKMDGFCNIGGVLVIRPHSALEFIELLREHIVEIDHLKISEEEKNKEMARLWKFIHSPEFENQMNSILQDVNKLKELDIDESKILKNRGLIEDNILKSHKLILDKIHKTRKG